MKRLQHMTIIALLAAVLAGSALAQAPRFRYIKGDSEAVDRTTHLTWRRCLEGMNWDGVACAGTPATFVHEAAVAHTQSQKGWRLPTAKELFSLVDRTQPGPVIDLDAFPGTPAEWFWSASLYDGYPGSAWQISFKDGEVRTSYNHHGYLIRLVR